MKSGPVKKTDAVSNGNGGMLCGILDKGKSLLYFLNKPLENDGSLTIILLVL